MDIDDIYASLFDDVPTLPTFGVMPIDFNIDEMFDDMDQSNGFANSPSGNLANDFQGLNVDVLQSDDTNFHTIFDPYILLPKDDSAPENPPSVEETSTQSCIVKSSSTINTTKFTNTYQYCSTGCFLQLAIAPSEYYHVRYEREMKDVIRYISKLNNAAVTLTISNPLSSFAQNMSFFLRITRLTVPYGPESLVLCHPYPIWINDENALVHNGSLFLPITGERIEIEKLTLLRLLQRAVKKVEQYRIFMPDQLDFDRFHNVNTDRVKDVINEYQLRYSVLHFQVFIVDENKCACPTDMQCHTQPMYEYDGSEGKNLPNAGQIVKKSLKRKSIGQLMKSTDKTIKPRKRMMPEGAYPMSPI